MKSRRLNNFFMVWFFFKFFYEDYENNTYKIPKCILPSMENENDKNIYFST